MNEDSNSRLPNPLIYTEYRKNKDGDDCKILLKDFIWNDPILGEIRVPAGFIFDGASIPKVAWTGLGLYPFSSEVVKAGLVHDFLYTKKTLPREECDKVLRRILRYENDLSGVTISIIYGAVRIGGSSSYEEVQEESEYFRPDIVKQFTN